ncbi:MAG: hypothetical protein IPM39_29535 [Chloroflexi bacterium]|nr:hypothetical protein [Chloroflexota bacterium]
MSRKQAPPNSEPAIPAAAYAAGLVYIGQNGAHISGLPARDLSPDEVALLSPEQVDVCLKSNLYEVNNES